MVLLANYVPESFGPFLRGDSLTKPPFWGDQLAVWSLEFVQKPLHLSPSSTLKWWVL